MYTEHLLCARNFSEVGYSHAQDRQMGRSSMEHMFQWGGRGVETEKQVKDTERQKVFVKQGAGVGNVGGKQ